MIFDIAMVISLMQSLVYARVSSGSQGYRRVKVLGNDRFAFIRFY